MKIFKRFVRWMYRKAIDELYVPDRKEWSVRAGGGAIRISSNTYPFQEKFIVGKVLTKSSVVQGQKTMSATVEL